MIVYYTKVVDNTSLAARGQRRFPSVSGWKSLSDTYLRIECCRSDGERLDGYYSTVETDSWYNPAISRTTDLVTAQSTDRFDLESIALYELGNGIELDDLNMLWYGDPRRSDLKQAMKLYDVPQREIRPGDRMGVHRLYRQPLAVIRVEIAKAMESGQFTLTVMEYGMAS